MLTPLSMYLLISLDTIRGIVVILIIGGALTLGIGLLFALGFPDNSPAWHPDRARAFKIGLGILFTGVVGCFIPSTKQMAAILIVPKIVNNASVQELPSKVLGLADAWIESLKPAKKKETR